jgi:N-sulfoglucosamine sulfohydrolase
MDRRRFLKSVASVGATIGLFSCAPKNPKRPNILFAIADDASFPHMGAYGCSWVKTPAFDRVAKEGLLFNNTYTCNAKCAPSRAAILTGRNSWQLEEACNHGPYWPAKFKTYAEVLAENGYFVGYTAKGWAPGNPGQINGKKRELLVKAFNKHKLEPPAKYINSNDYAANFEDFYGQKEKDQPFCFWYGSTEPHRRYEYGAGVNKGGKKLDDVDKVFDFWPDNKITRNDMLDYAFEVDYFDSHLQKMLALLEEKGELDNTIVLVTADNGMPFPRIKGQEYELSNHLPLAIMWKDGIKNPGRVVDDYVSFIDFAPTYLDVAGVSGEQKGMQPVTGKSLMDIFYSDKTGIVNPDRDHILFGKERHDVGRPNDVGYPIRGIVKGGYLYIFNFEIDRWPAGDPQTGYLNCDGSPTKTLLLKARKKQGEEHFWKGSFGKRPQEEFFNVKDDPECLNNLADNPDLSPLKNQLKDQLFAELKKQGDPRMFGNGHIFDEYSYANENNRDFYTRYMNGEEIKTGWVNPTDFEPDFPK